MHICEKKEVRNIARFVIGSYVFIKGKQFRTHSFILVF